MVARLPVAAARRTLIQLGAAALLFASALPFAQLARAQAGVGADEILLGQSTALTGPLAELGNDTAAAARAYFEHVNAQGGIHGRKIRLITLDDGYDADRGMANARRLIEKDGVFALFNMFGTPANTALLPLVAQAGIPSIAPFTGADAVRKPFQRHVFHVRAGYADEAEKIIEHLGVRGFDRIAVLYQNNGFGRDGLAAAEQALGKRKLKPHASATIESDAADAAQAATALAASAPQAVLMITAGKSSAEFIKAYNRIAPGMQFFTLSVMGTQASVAALGREGAGVVVSQVVPFPFSATSGIVREYQQVMARAGVKNWSFASMEGFLNAKVAVEGFKRAGRDLTRERFMTALESMGKLDFDGYVVDFGRNNRQGSRYVELTVIARDGRFMR